VHSRVCTRTNKNCSGRLCSFSSAGLLVSRKRSGSHRPASRWCSSSGSNARRSRSAGALASCERRTSSRRSNGHHREHAPPSRLRRGFSWSLSLPQDIQSLASTARDHACRRFQMCPSRSRQVKPHVVGLLSISTANVAMVMGLPSSIRSLYALPSGPFTRLDRTAGADLSARSLSLDPFHE
jgi:hypothetical protein